MRFFGFSQYLIDWTKILYNDFRAIVQNNGYFSDPFQVERSVHQGGPCSSFYFLICAELLAISLRTNQRIEGIPVQDIIHLIGQYADDADIYQKYSQQSLQETIHYLEAFQTQTGFTVSYEKTQIYRIGTLKDTQERVHVSRDIRWTNSPINVLGIYIAYNIQDVMDLNYLKYISHTENILNAWSNRGLSLIAKVNVINTLIGSLFVYKMTVLPTMSDELIKRFEKVFTSFLWSNKRPKISLKCLQCNTTVGGLGLVDLKCKDQAIKISWVQLIKQDLKFATLVYEIISPKIKHEIWKCNFKESDIKNITENAFWKDVLKAWARLNYDENPTYHQQIIWYNSLIKIGGKIIAWSTPIRKNLLHVSQLVENGKIIPNEVAKDKYGLTYLQLASIISAVPKSWLEQAKKETGVTSGVTTYDLIIDTPHIVSKVYKQFTANQKDYGRKIKKWEYELYMEIEVQQFINCVRDIYKVTNIAKYRSFQFRLLNRAIVTNIHLKYYKIKDHDLCTLCDKFCETYLHLFIYCEHVQSIWIRLDNWLLKKTNVQIIFGTDTVICNKLVSQSGHLANFACLVLKHYIYVCRCKNTKPSYKDIMVKLMAIQNMEKYIAIKNNKLRKHNVKWHISESGDCQDPRLCDNTDSVQQYINEYLINM